MKEVHKKEPAKGFDLRMNVSDSSKRQKIENFSAYTADTKAKYRKRSQTISKL